MGCSQPWGSHSQDLHGAQGSMSNLRALALQPMTMEPQ